MISVLAKIDELIKDNNKLSEEGYKIVESSKPDLANARVIYIIDEINKNRDEIEHIINEHAIYSEDLIEILKQTTKIEWSPLLLKACIGGRPTSNFHLFLINSNCDDFGAGELTLDLEEYLDKVDELTDNYDAMLVSSDYICDFEPSQHDIVFKLTNYTNICTGELNEKTTGYFDSGFLKAAREMVEIKLSETIYNDKSQNKTEKKDVPESRIMNHF